MLQLQRPLRFEPDQVSKSVSALLKHCRVERGKKALENSVYVDLQIAVMKVPSENKTKPKLVPLANPFFTLDESKICIFSPDPQDKYMKEIQSEAGPKICVIGLKQLKTKYKGFAVKKELCNEFDVFLAPIQLLPTLAPILGKAFYTKKKQPAGFKYKKDELKETIESAVESTRLMTGSGTTINIHIAKVSQSQEEIEENIIEGIKSIVRLLKGWNNIRTIHVKTDHSVALPIYDHTEYVDSDDSDTEF